MESDIAITIGALLVLILATYFFYKLDSEQYQPKVDVPTDVEDKGKTRYGAPIKTDKKNGKQTK